MSQLAQKIQDDIKAAMMARDAGKLDALRMLKSAVKNLEIANPGKPMTDEAVFQVIQKQLKQRQDAITEYEKAGRPELALKEKAEVQILSAYLPAMLSETELQAVIDDVLKSNALTSKKEFGKAMKLVQEKTAGKADNKRISETLNRILQ
ncbi:MAG: GatB/YqeY domain-containing protein [Candidatus Omnitrophica bacterium]|jgi:uncharacterized protein YqeY|nr:GatB/YqeY domain-containing protein [Candidatus Omnitrophota bacterium]